MQVDFYQLSCDPVEHVAALLADKALASGARVLIVSGAPDRRDAISRSLWSREGAFLAHGGPETREASRQPIVLGSECVNPNGAGMVILADGLWHEDARRFDRAFLLFDEERTQEARTLWSELSTGEDSLRIFKQRSDGAWREGR
ncbi:DNA polymerase III subunit chi [Qipengyuania sp.]|uniref:DNA polymerase III subunit chi n=1 Tax=Qipengyuania sp. TaxID=2004515 RepID=UPI0035C86318